MTVGIYLHDYEPAEGGGFTFVDTILNAFIRDLPGSTHSYVLLCQASAKDSINKKIGTLPNVKVTSLPKSKALNSAIVNLKYFFPVSTPVLNKFSSLLKVSTRENVQLMWFIGGMPYDLIDIPYVATVWDLQHRTHPWFPEVSSEGRWIYREQRYSQFLRRATHIITGTSAGKQELEFFYQIPANRVSMLPHPLPDIEAYPETDAETLFPKPDFLSRPYFIYPAQFWAHKNHINLIEALAVLRDRYNRDVNCVFTGSDKGNRQYVLSVAKKMNLGDRVFSLGFVSRQQLNFLYKHAAGLAYVSFSGPENLPPLEAFAQKCPVINSDFAGAREQLGDAALFIDAHDPEDIAAKMNSLLTDRTLRDKLIHAGAERVTSRTPQQFVKGVFQIFDRFARIRKTWE